MVFGKRWSVIGAIVILALSVGVAWRFSSRVKPAATNNTNTANPARERYAAIYEAAWRQDTTDGNTLVTATLVVPPMITALGNDSSRSDTEDRMYRAMKTLTDRQIGVLLTIDSVGGAIPDSSIKDGLQLASKPDHQTTTVAWQPFIAVPRVVNAPAGTTSQIGLAVFDLDQSISWDTLESVQVSVNNLGDEAHHQFSWASIPLLLAVQ